MDKYLKGARFYHLVEAGKEETKCGFDFSDTSKSNQLEDVKDQTGWPTCVGCAQGVIPEAVKLKKNHK